MNETGETISSIGSYKADPTCCCVEERVVTCRQFPHENTQRKRRRPVGGSVPGRVGPKGLALTKFSTLGSNVLNTPHAACTAIAKQTHANRTADITTNVLGILSRRSLLL